MPPAEWPQADRHAWEAALAPGDLLEDGGARARYALETNRKLVKNYARWLTWLSRRGLLDDHTPPTERITPERVKAFVADMAKINATGTILARLQALYEMAKVLDGRRDWRWIRRIVCEALDRIGRKLADVAELHGRAWGDTTIRGHALRGTGLLHNELYVGRLVWNRCSYVKDPRTGKRVARVNAKEHWEIVDMPELRILCDDLWERVKERQAMVRIEIGRDEHGNALNRAHRRRFLFSGLLVCGLCGGGYTIVVQDRYGCASHKSKGTCRNTRTILRPEIEERVLAG